jgi:hypothetical protein
MKPFFSSDCGPCLSKISLWKKNYMDRNFSRCGFVYALFRPKSCLVSQQSSQVKVKVNRTLKFIKHKHENTGAGHIFKSACWHLNRRISTGPCRMKTIRWSYIMESSRSFISRSQIIFWRSSSTSTVYFNVNNVMMTSFHQSPS